MYYYRKRVRLFAFILCATLGFLGVHRFYTGSPGYGRFLLFTLGGLGFLWIWDLWLLLIGDYNCGDGHYFVA